MVKIQNHLGTIQISNEYLTSLIGQTVTGCFGVVQMNPFGPKQGMLSVFNKNSAIDRGVIINFKNEKLIIDLHITVSYGVNISAVVDSVINKVRYVISEGTDLTVSKINVFIDGMKS